MSPHTANDTTVALEWDTAAMAMPGENVLGDRAVVMFAGQHALLAVIDGVGHGPAAAHAAHLAADVLERSADRDPSAATLDCHDALRGTRGAALSLASIDLRAHTMTWLGIGNVEARVLPGAEPGAVTQSLLLAGGVIGHELPRLSPQNMPITRGDLVILATDGIRRDFADTLLTSGSCTQIADRILHQHALGSDDALVLVARYLPRT